MKADTKVAATSTSPLFSLRENEWFAMERATLGDPDCSPVKILITQSAKKGGIVITFYEAFYPEGAREKTISLKNIERAESHLRGSESDGRSYLFLELKKDWLRSHFETENIKSLLDDDNPSAILDSVHFPE